MATLFVRHTVKDYAKWKRVYDQFAPTRKKLGVTGAGVYRDANGSNKIIVTHQFPDVKTAQKFAESDDLRTAMADAGVVGAPEMWFSEEVEQTRY